MGQLLGSFLEGFFFLDKTRRIPLPLFIVSYLLIRLWYQEMCEPSCDYEATSMKIKNPYAKEGRVEWKEPGPCCHLWVIEPIPKLPLSLFWVSNNKYPFALSHCQLSLLLFLAESILYWYRRLVLNSCRKPVYVSVGWLTHHQASEFTFWHFHPF